MLFDWPWKWMLVGCFAGDLHVGRADPVDQTQQHGVATTNPQRRRDVQVVVDVAGDALGGDRDLAGLGQEDGVEHAVAAADLRWDWADRSRGRGGLGRSRVGRAARQERQRRAKTTAADQPRPTHSSFLPSTPIQAAINCLPGDCQCVREDQRQLIRAPALATTRQSRNAGSIRSAQETIGITSWPSPCALRADRVDVVPDDLARPRDLEDPPAVRFGDQRVAVGQARLRGADLALERLLGRAGVGPDDLLRCADRPRSRG